MRADAGGARPPSGPDGASAMQLLHIGRERAPLLVIDEFAPDPEQLVALAAPKHFRATTRHFPGIRAQAPRSYQRLLLEALRRTLTDFFGLAGNSLSFSMCHYSLVTTPPERLAPIQRIPHIDSVDGGGLATVHYLFRGPYGGTAFYRHRSTGYESVDADRGRHYFAALERELTGPHAPPAAYIDGDTPLFEEIARQEGAFNRILVYRRNSLHSGSIAPGTELSPNPLAGRLSINSFIDVEP